MLIPFEVAGEPVTPGKFDVICTVTTSFETSELEVYVSAVAPVIAPEFTYH
jgi:hypothetical protein